MSQQIPATATLSDGHIYVDFGENIPVEGSASLHWSDGELAGALDYSKDGKLLGIEIIYVLREIANLVDDERTD